MPQAVQGVLRTNFEFSCDMPYDEIDEVNPRPGGTVAAALGEILKGLGCEVGEVADGGDHGWYLDFKYHSVTPMLEVTAIDGIVVQVHGPKLTGLLAAPKPPTDYVEILTRLGEAIQADPRFHDLGWFTPEELTGREVGALTPLGAYSSAPCKRYFGPEGDDSYVSPQPPPPFQPDIALDAPGWTDLAPHPIRRWAARLFDFWITTGLVFAVIAIALLVIDPKMEAIGALVGLLTAAFLLSPLRALVSAPLNALFLSRFSTTPGKWLCGIRIVRKDGSPLTYGVASRREFGALFAGCGFYLPLIALIAAGYNFFQLKKNGATSWDLTRGLVAVQRANSTKQAVLTALALILVAVIAAVLALAGDALKAQRLAGG